MHLFNERFHMYSLYFLDDTIIEPHSVGCCRRYRRRDVTQVLHKYEQPVKQPPPV